MTDLSGLYDALDPPSVEGGGQRFTVSPIDDDLRYLMGKDEHGGPAVLVESTTGQETPLRVELQHLSIQPEAHCAVVFPNGVQRDGVYTLIRCAGDEELRGLFLSFMAGLLDQLRTSAAAKSLDLPRVVLRLVDLFRAMSITPRRSVQGLWAELFLMANAHDSVTLASAWHRDPVDLFDFNDEQQRIDVKSASRRGRTHRVGLEQLIPPPPARGFLASIVIESAGGGRTVEDLVQLLAQRLSARIDLQLKLRTVVTETLGTEWRQGARVRFDWQRAHDSCALYSVTDVPKIDPAHVPSAISHIQFDVNLDDIAPLSSIDIQSAGGLVAAALPV